MREVVADAAATFHQLHLFLVDADDGTIAVGVAIHADDKAVGKRGNLEVVSDAGHRAALRHNVAEVVEQAEDLVSAHRVGVALFDAGYLAGDAAVHVGGCLLVDVAERVFHGILVDPYLGGQFVAVEVCKGGLIGLVVGVRFLFHVGCLIVAVKPELFCFL